MDLKFKPYAHPVAVGLVVCCIDFFSLVLGELLPKRIGLNHPEAIAKAVALPMKIVSIVTAPFIWLLTHSTDFFECFTNKTHRRKSNGGRNKSDN
jgi:putative hemolysin